MKEGIKRSSSCVYFGLPCVFSFVSVFFLHLSLPPLFLFFTMVSVAAWPCPPPVASPVSLASDYNCQQLLLRTVTAATHDGRIGTVLSVRLELQASTSCTIKKKWCQMHATLDIGTGVPSMIKTLNTLGAGSRLGPQGHGQKPRDRLGTDFCATMTATVSRTACYANTHSITCNFVLAPQTVTSWCR